MKPVIIFVIIFTLLNVSLHAREIPLAPEGQALAAFLDSLRVEELWSAGRRVDWRTGQPKTGILKDGKLHTHCSAFVAAAAYKLDIYVLRPPDHSETLLANAQFDWLAGSGKNQGWFEIASGVSAQALANQGLLVLAAYKNRQETSSGHIAIVRPDNKDEKLVLEEGPQIIQAGTQNHRSIGLQQGFRQHPRAFKPGGIRFFAHAVDISRLKKLVDNLKGTR